MTTRAAADRQPIVLSFTFLQAAFDWGLKLIPILGFAIQFYMSQDRTQDRSRQNSERIVKLESELNEIKRALSDAQAEQRVQKQQMEDQKEFYSITRASK